MACNLLSLIIAGFMYFRKPQENSEKADAVMQEKITTIEKTLAEMNISFQAHVQADLLAMNGIGSRLGSLDGAIVKLSTIIDERIPKKI